MKTNQIKRLLVLGAVACLPIACGTSSPTGLDVAAIEANTTVSAFRADPTGPEAPEAPSPDPIPVPEIPVKDDPTSDQVPSGTDPSPAPTDRSGRRPTPQPSTQPDPGVDPSPNDDPGTVPTPDTGGRTPPAPSTTPNPVEECLAVSVEIGTLSTFAGTNGASLEATLLDENGLAITDSSCEKVLWTAEGSDVYGGHVSITYGASSRFVTVSGPAGTYKVGATTPNGQSAVLVITLP